MTSQTRDSSHPQIPMPGMPSQRAFRRILSSGSVAPGQLVEYHGRISGGPRFGLKGKIVQTRPRHAVVDLGTEGAWNIPYYFLTVPTAA